MNFSAILYMCISVTVIVWPLIMFFSKKQLQKSQWLFLCTQIILFYEIQLYATYLIPELHHEYVLDYLFTTIALYLPVMFFLFIVSMTSKEGVKRAHRRLFLIPFAYTVLMLVMTFLLNASGYKVYLDRAVYGNDLSFVEGEWRYNLMIVVNHYLFVVMLVGEIVAIVVSATIRTLRFHNTLQDYYANHYALKRKADRRMVFVAFAMIAIAFFLARFPLDRMPSEFWGVAMAVVAAIAEYVLGFYVYHIEYSAETLDNAKKAMISPQPTIHNSQLTAHNSPLTARIVDFVENGQYFLNPKANLIDVSNALHVSDVQIIEVLYRDMESNFSHYVNGLRINMATNLLLDLEASGPLTRRKIESVYTRCGYDNLADFRYYFSLVMGQDYKSWLSSGSEQ